MDKRVLFPIRMSREERDMIHLFAHEHGFSSTNEFARHALAVALTTKTDARAVGKIRAQRSLENVKE